ncbi:hypothetical protein QBA57_39610 [Streptomyces scabiei]|uniref:hypothetical protein n=1 Tax=Streptomyces scabiei TaxID=1930 RepID=UPI0029A34630|nr:hypothetical protein [Streptomyces scabiei]MDX2566097.1 hypothetical protein [Streptomyces scabiei]MDX3149623.1 hypothetical protein [Streptomyces scabiei]MDX3161777.1 hypothetical protein [Streptomyces scabiei]MDX3288137.1 hypothetical protein [Streptomyces scabiei]
MAFEWSTAPAVPEYPGGAAGPVRFFKARSEAEDDYWTIDVLVPGTEAGLEAFNQLHTLLTGDGWTFQYTAELPPSITQSVNRHLVPTDD